MRSYNCTCILRNMEGQHPTLYWLLCIDYCNLLNCRNFLIQIILQWYSSLLHSPLFEARSTHLYYNIFNLDFMLYFRVWGGGAIPWWTRAVSQDHHTGQKGHCYETNLRILKMKVLQKGRQVSLVVIRYMLLSRNIITL